MARKRGGLAGIWDRNKGVIKTLAPAALSFIPGVGVPLAAAAGAAMGGLDRPGKGGIGLDIGGAIKGGISGYTVGKGTQALAGGVKSLLAPKVNFANAMGNATGAVDQVNASLMANPAMSGVPTSIEGLSSSVSASAPTSYIQTFGGGMPASEVNAMRESARRGAGMLSRAAAPQAASAVGGAGGAVGTAAQSAVQNAAQNIGTGGGFLNKLRQNKDLLEMAGKGILSSMPRPESQADIMKAETDRMRFEEEKRQMEMEQERRRAIAQLLMPLARQNFPSYFGTTG